MGVFEVKEGVMDGDLLDGYVEVGLVEMYSVQYCYMVNWDLKFGVWIVQF